MAEPADTSIGCRDQCGARVADHEAAERAGWSWLSILGAWRCGACEGALWQARDIKGTGAGIVDELPPTSRGALRKETASTIDPPRVKP